MSLARTRGVVVNGVDGLLVDIEAYLSQGLPGMTIVGLADTAVGESRDRVRAAILNSELSWPMERRITVGLSPASIHKRGAALDLGIALAILMAHQVIPEFHDTVVVGELGLDGTVKPVNGGLLAAITAAQHGVKKLIISHRQIAEAQLVPDVDVIGVTSLRDVVAYVRGEARDVCVPDEVEHIAQSVPDLCDVRGQREAKYGLEVAAVGGHHVAFLGPPGVGKTMLASRLPGLLPELNDEEALAVTKVYSAAGLLKPGQGLIRIPPFQSPHHTATMASLIGGGSHSARVGLVTLAHNGVMCIDEAAEFDRSVLDSLRQPLEHGEITIARAGFSATMPARFQLVLASNPCPCGQFIGTGANCSCSPLVRRRYLGRLSGPLMDRIDVRVTLEKPTMADLDPANAEPESSSVVWQRVQEARERSAYRLRGTQWTVNAHIPGPALRRAFPLDIDVQRALMREAVRMSARGLDRVLRIAWSIADLQAHDRPTHDDVQTALQLRDGGSWQTG